MLTYLNIYCYSFSKMGWKNWPYWVRGGITGIIVSIIYPLLIFFIAVMLNAMQNKFLLDQPIAIIFIIPMFFLFFALFAFGISSASGSLQLFTLLYSIGLILLHFITYFVIGAIIGLVYGKIKKRKEENAIKNN